MMILCDNCLRGSGKQGQMINNISGEETYVSLCDSCFHAFAEGDMVRFHARFTRERTVFFFRDSMGNIDVKDDSPIGEADA